MIKRFIIALVLLVLVCGGIVGFNIFRSQMIANFFANMPQQTVAVSTTEVVPTTWRPGIEAVGTVVARQGVDVASQASGVVSEILFEANQRVEAGAVLVRIESAVEQAELIAARAAVTRDQQNLERARELATRGVNSEATLEQAQAQLDTSRSTLERVQAVLEQKDIKAPFTGIIGIPRIDIGQYMTPGSVIATLQDLDTMKVDFTVPEQRLQAIEIDQPVLFGLTRESMPYQGAISGIDPKIDPQSRLISVQAVVANSDGLLRPGQFINVEVQLAEETNVVALPQTAVVTSLYGSYVYVVQEKQPDAAAPAADGAEATEAPPANTPAEGDAAPAEGAEAPAAGAAAPAAAGPTLVARQVFVETGRRNGTRVEILSGLEPGAQVVTAGQNRLSNGSPVTVDNTVDPEKTGKTSPAAGIAGPAGAAEADDAEGRS